MTSIILALVISVSSLAADVETGDGSVSAAAATAASVATNVATTAMKAAIPKTTAVPATAASPLDPDTQSIRFLNGEFSGLCTEKCNALAPDAPQECRDTYQKFLSKEPVKVSLTLGYTDIPHMNDVQDKARTAALISQLLRPCPRSRKIGACGFKQDPGEHELSKLFVKTIRYPEGPDGSDHTIELRLESSAASSDDSYNHGAGRAAQVAQSERAVKNFDQGVKEGDVLIYVGHGRYGKGPSMVPRDQQVETFTKMIAALKARDPKPSFIGEFACNSQGNWSTPLRNAVGATPLIATSKGDTDVRVLFRQGYAYLDSVLAMRCRDEFKRAMGTAEILGLDGGGPEGYSMTGQIFDPQSKTEANVVTRDGTASTLSNTSLIRPPADDSVKIQVPPNPSGARK